MFNFLSKTLMVLSLVFIFIFGFEVLASGQTQFKAERILPAAKGDVKIISRVPAFNLIDHKKMPVGSSDLYGKIWVVNFIHTGCGDICDKQTHMMKVLQGAITPQVGDDIRYVTVTINPETDTPDVLADYVKEKQLNTSQWHVLTGRPQAVLEFYNKGFGGAVDTQLDKEGAHYTGFALVDWEGRVRGYYDGLSSRGLDDFKRDFEHVYFERTAFPSSLQDGSFIDPRNAQQKALAKTLDIFTDFEFSNQIDKSGITFRHKLVDDVGLNYKALHYDHGNALAIADVDLDGLHDIYFTTLSGTNELWRNLGGGEFENITQWAGLNLSDRIGMGASFADIDNDGDPDLYISNIRVGNVLFENNGKGRFKDITASSGTAVKAHSSSATFFDYDRDGLLDLFVTNVGKYTTDEVLKTSLYGDHGQVKSDYEYYVGFKDAFAGHLKPERAEASVLFKNLGNNRFEDVSQKTNLVDKGWSGEASVIDGNNDGWPDLYIVSMQGDDEYYENQQGKRFVRKSREVFPKTPWGAMGVKSFDYDNDGDMDLYVTDMHSDMHKAIGFSGEKLKVVNPYTESFLQTDGRSIFGNAFYRNDGDGSFTEISDQIGLENYWPWGPGSGDLNADGYEDLFVASSMGYPFRYGVSSVFLNKKGQGFIDSEYMLGVEPRRNNVLSAPWFELDCHNKDKRHQVCKKSKARGNTVVWGALGSRSSAIFDVDQDGDLDIVTLEFNHLPRVLMSDLSEKKKINYLKVDLLGKSSNKSGIGARVTVVSGDSVFTKINDGKSGYLAQSDAPLYFGLGDKRKIDKIEVIWPSGVRQVLSDDLVLNNTFVIAEP